MRLIDANALPVHKAYCVDEAGWGANFYVVDKSDIDKAPTIDAVPVVRCEKCACFDEMIDRDSGKPAGYGRCRRPFGLTGIISADDFCSYGERRSDD